eukprot:CAMPEP_0185837856 /NCGR_PEP_ID=MMETSP1353-20130828/12114_1 /TAXON_ID=1077150 /ORGANISM="Erythrolobus australicus, Strain CCMP3124" /LENGTH=294 /DNA_ID=CAMNT_0028536833 /DNA_START=104 /DNA_END=988 /DNA_ORIENTATION=-
MAAAFNQVTSSEARQASPAPSEPFLSQQRYAFPMSRKSSLLRLVPSEPDMSGLDCLGASDEILGLSGPRSSLESDSPLLPSAGMFDLNTIAMSPNPFDPASLYDQPQTLSTPMIGGNNAAATFFKHNELLRKHGVTAYSSDGASDASGGEHGCDSAESGCEDGNHDSCQRSEWSGGNDSHKSTEPDADQSDIDASFGFANSDLPRVDLRRTPSSAAQNFRESAVFQTGTSSKSAVRKTLRWPRRRSKNIKGMRKNYAALKAITDELAARAIALSAELKTLTSENAALAATAINP